MRRSRSILAALVAAATLAIMPGQHGRAQGVLGESGLVGELEGAKVQRDAPRPAKLGEAPMLAELVKAGKLPPVEQRVPDEPLVIQPVHEIGKYGGTWRRGFTGPGDVENGNRINASDKPLFWDFTGTEIVPSVARGWEQSADGKTFTLFLRKGMKWSDGAPFTADDFVFWFEDLYSNKEIVPTPIADMQPQGKPGRVVKIDDTTVQFQFDVPYYLFEDMMAGDTLIGGGQSVRQSQKFTFGAYSPKHYLSQFLPKNSSVDEANAKAKEAGYENWVQYLHFKKDWALNPELPTLGPWKTVQPINTPTWVLERNPFYWAVDTEGNQLPYIDRVQLTLAENLEVLNLRAVAGEYDLQERHIDIAKLPVILENQEKGGYTVHLDQAYNGSDSVLQINQSYDADPEIAKWLTNADFRRALSLGLDRDQLNETFWLGVGMPGSVVPAESSPYNPGPEYRTTWSTHDVDKANAMLDALGLTKKDARRLPPAHRQWRAAADRDHGHPGVPALSQAGGDDRRPVAQDRHRRRGQGERAQSGDDPDPQQRAPHLHVDQWRHRAALSVPAPRDPGRSDRGLYGTAVRAVVRVQRCAGQGADRPESAEDLPAVPRGVEPAEGGADQDGPGDLEDPGRSAVRDRHGRPVAGLHGRAPGQQQAGQHPLAGVHRPALPHAGRLASRDVVLQGMTLTAAG